MTSAKIAARLLPGMRGRRRRSDTCVGVQGVIRNAWARKRRPHTHRAALLKFALEAEAARFPVTDDDDAPDRAEEEHARQRAIFLARNLPMRLAAEAEAAEAARTAARAKPLRGRLHPVELVKILAFIPRLSRGGNGKLRGVARIVAPAICTVLTLLLERTDWFTLEHDPRYLPFTIASLAEAAGLGSRRYGERTVRAALRTIVGLGLADRLDPNAVRFRLRFRSLEELKAIVGRAVKNQMDARRTRPPVPPCVSVGLPPYSSQETITDSRPPSGGDASLSPPTKMFRPGRAAQPAAARAGEALARAGVFTPTAGTSDTRDRRAAPPSAPPARPREPERPAPPRVPTAEPGRRDESPGGRESTRRASAPGASGRPPAKNTRDGVPPSSDALGSGTGAAFAKYAHGILELLEGLSRSPPE